jgi:hypothetical protein
MKHTHYYTFKYRMEWHMLVAQEMDIAAESSETCHLRDCTLNSLKNLLFDMSVFEGSTPALEKSPWHPNPTSHPPAYYCHCCLYYDSEKAAARTAL